MDDYKIKWTDVVLLALMGVCFILAAHIDYLFIADGLIP